MPHIRLHTLTIYLTAEPEFGKVKSIKRNSKGEYLAIAQRFGMG